mmetsp:Transcript_56460/g.168079  ORF Transcript_56460/g.168079 Transcript_56460/m.168079 type:complete len:153 (-) Transcript_56460:17-475(-)
MGAVSSGCCSSDTGLHPTDMLREAVEMPAEGSGSPMQVAASAAVAGDRIDPWSTNLGSAVDMPQDVVAVLSCGGSTSPPDDILADSQQGSIVLRSLREGPIFKPDLDGKEDDLVVDIDPEKLNQYAGEITVPLFRREGRPDIPMGRALSAAP